MVLLANEEHAFHFLFFLILCQPCRTMRGTDGRFVGGRSSPFFSQFWDQGGKAERRSEERQFGTKESGQLAK